VSKNSEEELMMRVKKSCEAQDKPIYLEEPSAISLIKKFLRSK